MMMLRNESIDGGGNIPVEQTLQGTVKPIFHLHGVLQLFLTPASGVKVEVLSGVDPRRRHRHLHRHCRNFCGSHKSYSENIDEVFLVREGYMQRYGDYGVHRSGFLLPGIASWED